MIIYIEYLHWWVDVRTPAACKQLRLGVLVLRQLRSPKILTDLAKTMWIFTAFCLFDWIIDFVNLVDARKNPGHVRIQILARSGFKSLRVRIEIVIKSGLKFLQDHDCNPYGVRIVNCHVVHLDPVMIVGWTFWPTTIVNLGWWCYKLTWQWLITWVGYHIGCPSHD